MWVNKDVLDLGGSVFNGRRLEIVNVSSNLEFDGLSSP